MVEQVGPVVAREGIDVGVGVGIDAGCCTGIDGGELVRRDSGNGVGIGIGSNSDRMTGCERCRFASAKDGRVADVFDGAEAGDAAYGKASALPVVTRGDGESVNGHRAGRIVDCRSVDPVAGCVVGSPAERSGSRVADSVVGRDFSAVCLGLAGRGSVNDPLLFGMKDDEGEKSGREAMNGIDRSSGFECSTFEAGDGIDVDCRRRWGQRPMQATGTETANSKTASSAR